MERKHSIFHRTCKRVIVKAAINGKLLIVEVLICELAKFLYMSLTGLLRDSGFKNIRGHFFHFIIVGLKAVKQILQRFSSRILITRKPHTKALMSACALKIASTLCSIVP